MNIAIDAGVVALIVGLVEVLKNLGLSSKYAPAASLVLGVIYSVALPTEGIHIAQAVVEGVAIGLAASGLYSGTKAMLRPAAEPIDEL